jgi:hypothetical protein
MLFMHSNIRGAAVAVNKSLICKCISPNNQPILKCNYCAYGKDEVTPSNFYWVMVWLKEQAAKYRYYPNLGDIVNNSNHCDQLQNIRDKFLCKVKSGALSL